MITAHQTTPEEQAYERLLDETWEKLSWPGRTFFRLAYGLSYAEHMVRNYMTGDEDYDETEDKMSFVAAGITDRDQELLTQIVRAARTAADSLDPEDDQTVAGFRVHPANLHHWYEMTAEWIERTLRDENARRSAMEDPSYIPY